MLLALWVAAFAATLFGARATSLPTPASKKVCTSLRLGSSHRAGRDTRPPPVELTTSADKFSPGQNITVSLNGRPGVQVQRFAVQAREISSFRPVGTFVNRPSTAQTVDCGHQNDTIISRHGNGTETRNLSLTWTAPNNTEIGDVEFIANVRQVGEASWANLKSRRVRQIEPNFPPINMSECGTVKGCFRYGKKDCTAETCRYAMSYRTEGENVVFELAADTDGWVAVGFSSDRMMNGDDVLACVNARKGRQERVLFRHYYNNHHRPAQQDINPIIGHGTLVRDGRIYCRFTRPRKVDNDNYSVDLDATWYFLYAWGPANDGNIMRHTLESPPTSYRKVIITSKVDDQRDSSNPTTANILLLCSTILLCQFLKH
ncbi:PREDICTED: putative ferric-chelate reductase 1 [Branchiostoma belcheri]|uniref:Ferric-chelate reductase 1 n=1 Tax=Branchiostoma belcheri TaxID=7741 RepID=A0A6P4ZZI8_BRABE|nr:PREDICTED: putative ferric-chelate reductase 1 [Branchiostoma belcheri]